MAAVIALYRDLPASARIDWIVVTASALGIAVVIAASLYSGIAGATMQAALTQQF